MELKPVNAKEQRRLDQKKTGKTVSSGSSVFEASLSEAVAVDIERSVDALMNDLNGQERRFLDAQNLIELMKYKQLLQKVLKLIMSESFESATIQRRRRDRADFFIVRQINEKVDLLTRKVASHDNKAFDLMSSIEEIRGLLFDLMH